MPQPVLIDTDPGIDDTLAILFALRSPELQIVGITTVFGNHHVETTTRNALRVLELVGRDDIAVARGADHPLLRLYSGPRTHVHGRDGLGDAGVAAEPQRRPDHRSAAQFIVEAAMARPGEVTLVALGPLTNLALALTLEPRLVPTVKQVVLMGGTLIAPGNASPIAERNIHDDPEAASLVFGAPWPVVMVGLDVTRDTVMSTAYLNDLAAAHNPYTDIIARITPLYLRAHEQHYGLHGGFHPHDPCALAYVLDPTLFTTAHYRVRIETRGLADGAVIADRQGQWYDGARTEICVGVEAPRLLALFKERLTA